MLICSSIFDSIPIYPCNLIVPGVMIQHIPYAFVYQVHGEPALQNAGERRAETTGH
jgi:hypothetical protein